MMQHSMAVIPQAQQAQLQAPLMLAPLLQLTLTVMSMMRPVDLKDTAGHCHVVMLTTQPA
jgi:hypothetical protein